MGLGLTDEYFCTCANLLLLYLCELAHSVEASYNLYTQADHDQLMIMAAAWEHVGIFSEPLWHCKDTKMNDL